ncbi:glycoside hydrolase family 5 protein [Aerosakkonema funiforme]|uniref:glycoside hydrolase family 5 protein n=1 Tax=Aerosakkonema funiforme TaxID=1246630 RepID=UPI0035B8615B
MKIIKLFSITIICCMMPGIAYANEAISGSESLQGDQSISNIVDTRFDELTRGINLTGWFSQTSSFNFDRITDSDLETIKSLGFEHVRLPIDSAFLFNENNPGVLNTKYLSYLDSALDKILAQDLSVIIDLSPEDKFKQLLANDDVFVNSVSQFWKTLAGHLSTRNPEQVFLETLNEPAFGYFLSNNPSINPVKRWNEVQGKLLAAMREGAPNHTLIAKGFDWDGIDGLKALTPVEDPNVVYNFHFYEPMVFTHQGADWMDEAFLYLHDLPYPYNQEDCAALIPTIIDVTATEWAQSYCDAKWDAAKIEARIGEAAAWAQKNNVRITANEFGVYRSSVAEDDRIAWIHDTRVALEKYDIGWAMWEYAGGFGLTEKNEEGVRIPNENVVAALGLYVEDVDDDEDDDPPRRIPEPRAIAGFVFLTLLFMRVKRVAHSG